MSKRTILKSIAFVCGLYFLLEFVLPARIGGDFDAQAVHSPAPAHTAAGDILLYVGQYDDARASLGRLVSPASPGLPWRREPEEPVLQRSLFVGYEKSGMRQLDAVAGPEGIDLFYLGLSRKQTATLCHAVGDPAGGRWQRTGAVKFAKGGGAPRPTVDEPNGELPGELQFFAAEGQPGRWTLLLVLQRAGARQEVWQADGARLDAMQLAPEPLLGGDRFPAGVTAFEAQRAPEGGWMLDFAQGTNGVRLIQEPGAGYREEPLAVAAGGASLASLRRGSPAGAVAAGGTTPSPEKKTVLYLQPAAAEGAPAPRLAAIRETGRPALELPLSQGLQTVGNYLQIIGSFAVFIALINLTLFHGKRILRRQRGGFHSAVFFVFVAMMALFTYNGRAESAIGTGWRAGYDFLFAGVLTPMGTAVFSMITFYMISAAYRSFRIRSFEAALLMLSACVVMIGQMPIGAWLGGFLPDSLACLRLPWLAEKLLVLINACAYRGVLIGLTVGGFSIGLRVWLGIDNSVYSGLEEDRR